MFNSCYRNLTKESGYCWRVFDYLSAFHPWEKFTKGCGHNIKLTARLHTHDIQTTPSLRFDWPSDLSRCLSQNGKFKVFDIIKAKLPRLLLVTVFSWLEALSKKLLFPIRRQKLFNSRTFFLRLQSIANGFATSLPHPSETCSVLACIGNSASFPLSKRSITYLRWTDSWWILVSVHEA